MLKKGSSIDLSEASLLLFGRVVEKMVLLLPSVLLRACPVPPPDDRPLLALVHAHQLDFHLRAGLAPRELLPALLALCPLLPAPDQFPSEVGLIPEDLMGAGVAESVDLPVCRGLRPLVREDGLPELSSVASGLGLGLVLLDNLQFVLVLFLYESELVVEV